MRTRRRRAQEPRLSDPPSLRFGQSRHIVAVDPAGYILVGGIGVWGMSEMWMRTVSSKDDEDWRQHPGYDKAPARACPEWDRMMADGRAGLDTKEEHEARVAAALVEIAAKRRQSDTTP